MKRFALAALAALALGCVAAAPAHGQRPQPPDEDIFNLGPERTKGLSVGVHVGVAPGVSFRGEGANSGAKFETSAGYVFGGRVGWGFTPNISVFANYDRAALDGDGSELLPGHAPIEHYELGARWTFRPGNERILPFANLGVGGRELHAKGIHPNSLRSGHLLLSGREITAGGGAQYFLGNDFALTGDLQVGFGRFNKMKFSGVSTVRIETEQVTTPRLTAGITWYNH